MTIREYRTLGHTGLEVSPLGLGCLGFGSTGARTEPWVLDEDKSRACIRRALELGINLFDTANVYSGGTSEEVLGRAIADFADRDAVVVATKVFSPMRSGPNSRGLSRKSIMAEAEASLRRLGTDHIDLYQIHRWDHRTPLEETLAALDDLVRSGKVRYLGASSMFAWQFSKYLFTADLHRFERFVSMQNQYNLLYREEEREMLPLCLDQGVAVLPWSPLARGRLARRVSATARTRSEGTTPYGAPHEQPIVDRVMELAERHGRSSAQIALAWLRGAPGVTAPILGATSVTHVEEAVGAMDLQLSATERAWLEEPYEPLPVSDFY